MENVQESEIDELLEELMIVQAVVKENPCRMPKSVMRSLKNVLHDFIGKNCLEGASREEVALYFGKDVRTITRWKQEYPDFPLGKTLGKRELSYSWIDIVHWKLKHKELFEQKKNN